MEEHEDKNKLDRLQEQIYGRRFENTIQTPNQHFSPENTPVEERWKEEAPHVPPRAIPIPTDEDLKPPKKSFVKKIFIGVLIFFILSAGVLGYMFFAGWNVISASNVELSFNGPVTVSAGNALDYSIAIANQNNSPITNAVLYIDYPDGTKTVEDITADLLHDKLTLGDLAAKSATTTPLKAILFGELNAKRDIKATLAYGLKNSNASYHKDATYEVTISSTPLTFAITHPQTVITNTPMTVSVTVTSNSSAPLTNLLVKADYPFGFSFTSATPAPLYEKNYWLIPLLKPGETQTITLSGIIQGEQNDERAFHFSIGTQDPNNEKNIATRYLTQTESVIIQKPPLAVGLLLNGSSTPTLSTTQGTSIEGAVEITNNTTVRIINPEVRIELGGQLYDASSVLTANGFFDSTSHSIVWNKSNTTNLDSLNPGEKKTFNFTFSTLPASKIAVKNGTMTLTASVHGNQADASNQDLTSTVSSTIQTKTSIGALSRVVYSSGPFRNKGPIPPKVGARTTYTVVWTATNSTNDVQGAVMRATLPSYVKFITSSPTSEPVTWNQDKNEVLWRVGDLAAGTGVNRQARSVSFQIELTPSLSQVGDQPNLVTDTTLSATDSFTNSTLSVGAPDLTTRLSSDPQYNGTEALVTK